MPEQPPKDLAYYLTLFKLAGHSTWRAHLAGSVTGFDDEQKKNWGKTPAKVTDRQTLRFDRITGTFKSL